LTDTSSVFKISDIHPLFITQVCISIILL
jgi:hypothetical protein